MVMIMLYILPQASYVLTHSHVSVLIVKQLVDTVAANRNHFFSPVQSRSNGGGL